MAVAMIGPKFYAWNRDGKPLAFGKLYTYQARTNTPKPTYQSEDQQVENSNPVILNGEGYANVYLSGSYKMVLKDNEDNEIWSSDPVSSSQAEEWVGCLSASYLSPTSFSLYGNQTDIYTVGRTVRINSNQPTYQFSEIKSSSYSDGNTVVEVLDSVVTTGIVESCVSVLTPDSSINGSNIGLYSNYIFSSIQNMVDGITIGSKKILHKEGFSYLVVGENDQFIQYDVRNSSGGVSLGGGLYAHSNAIKASLIKPNIANSQQEYDDNKPSSMPTLAARDLIGVYVEVANADAGGSIYTFKKSGNGFIGERLVSGRPSGGDSISLSCPAWRYGRVDYVSNLAAYKHQYNASNIGGIAGSEVTTAGTIWSGGTSVLQNGFKLWRVTGAGGYVDYLTSGDEISLLLGSNADATASLTVQIWTDEVSSVLLETHDIKTNITTGTDVFFWKARNPAGGRPVRVRFVGDSDYMYLGGVNASNQEFATRDIDHIAFYMIQDNDRVFNEGEGAQNYTIKELTTGLFGGESHGGEFMSRRNVYFDDDLQSLASGTYFVCGRVGIEQRSQVIWDDPNDIKMSVTSSLTVTSEGSQFCGDFQPNNLVADTAYFAMFTHQGTFDRVRFPKHIDVSLYTDPTQLQTGQGSGFKVMDAKGRIAEASWSEIFNINPNYKPYLQVKPQNNPYNKYYYGLALPPEGGVTINPFSYVSTRKYSC